MCWITKTFLLKTIDVNKLPEILEEIKSIPDRILETKGAMIGYMEEEKCLIQLQPLLKHSQAMLPAPQITGELKLVIDCDGVDEVFKVLEKVAKKIKDKCIIECS